MNEIIIVIVPDTICDFSSDSQMPALHNEHYNCSKFFTVIRTPIIVDQEHIHVSSEC